MPHPALATPGAYHNRRLRRSELARENFARGEARGEAKAVLAVLAARGVTVPTAIREQFLACSDLDQLDTWVHRAATAHSVEDVLRD